MSGVHRSWASLSEAKFVEGWLLEKAAEAGKAGAYDAALRLLNSAATVAELFDLEPVKEAKE